MAAKRDCPGIRAEPYDYGSVAGLAGELGLPEPVATVLARRGYAEPAAARDFLEAAESHPATALDGVVAAVERILAAIDAGDLITVHGDYDVDGVCATAIVVAAVRRLGGEVNWHIPDRLGDGYGLSAATVERLAQAGTRLLITVDCGITSVAEVAAAREHGLEVIVTDHHEPGEGLPECTLVHPRLGGYPFGELCGAAVAHKLAAALIEAREGAPCEPDLDLVALATIADMVPLVGENRSLARRGLAEIRRAPRPGLRALLEAASVLPERFSERDVSFRIAPRINAAGRLYRADACVELLLSDSPERARELSEHLAAANRERREIEAQVAEAADAAARALPGGPGAWPAMVLAGEGWHPGVVGIVASRIAEKHGKPAVLIALGDEGTGKGSGRSVPGFDLLAGLEACADLLLRFGGHRAAAGLEIAADEVDRFRERLCEHVAAAEHDPGLVSSTPIDAIVGAEALDHELATQLERLGPFGSGNPPVRLLVPAARLSDVRRMGDGERHARFTISAGAGRAQGVAFSIGKRIEALATEPHDLAVTLELNEWNGATAPRAVLDTAIGPEDTPAEVPRGCPDRAGDEQWLARLGAELDRDPGAPPLGAGPSERSEADRRGGSAVAALAELISAGGSVLAVCAEAERRRALLERALRPARFGVAGALACGHCSDGAVEAAAGEIVGGASGICLVDWQVLGRDPGLAEGFEHVALVDPPPLPDLGGIARAGDGWLHLLWGANEAELALRVLDSEWGMREALADCFRALRDRGEQSLRAALEGSGRHPRSPESIARCLRVLSELGLVSELAGIGDGELSVVSSVRTDLGRSPAFRAYDARYRESREFLWTQKTSRPRVTPAVRAA